MTKSNKEESTYIYHYACAEEEISLCALEIRTLFGKDTASQFNSIESTLKIDPSRSPFIRERIDIMFQGESLGEVMSQVKEMPLVKSTFKVNFISLRDTAVSEKLPYVERKKIERDIGLHVPGKADLHHPKIVFGITFLNGRWVFGDYHENDAIWLQHKSKPHSYSTALNTRVARAIVNIAVPDPIKVKVIDPCCGIGTVLIEALSMGIDIVGSDINPLVMAPVRENIDYFGLEGDVELKDIRDVTGVYDVAIIDLPYNLCSVISDLDKIEMLKSARSFTSRLVIVTVEPINTILEEVGFKIIDRCELRKRKFVREIIVCE